MGYDDWKLQTPPDDVTDEEIERLEDLREREEDLRFEQERDSR